MEQRYLQMHDIQARSADNEDPVIEGYFAVFDDVYTVAPGATESIRAGAFADSISGDVRALYNHNNDIVLGRTSAGTLELREDSHGLWGRIKIDPSDTDAMNVYRRIQRGSITGCSFGFNIESQETEVRDNGDVHWTITKVNPLYEISPVAFPAYESTNVSARMKDLDEIKTRMQEAWRERMLKKLKGDQNDGTESTDAAEEDRREE